MCDTQPLRKSSLKTSGSTRNRNQHVLIKVPDSDRSRPYKFRTRVLVGSLVVLVVIAAIAGGIVGNADKNRRREPPDPVDPLLPSASILHVFQRAAVCTDAPLCSNIGRSIFLQNGSAVDAAIAAMFCNGFLNPQSTGIGGGFFMTVFIKETEKAYVVNAREKAPLKASKDMFHGNGALGHKGPLAVGVPGEVRGLWAAHQRWGKLPWATLLEPTLKLCDDGLQLSKVMYDGFDEAPWIQKDPNLREAYWNTVTNKFHTPGTMIKPSKNLCTTIRRIAEKGGDELYNGTLAVDFLNDLQQAGSIITAEDLKSYEAEIVEPLSLDLGNGQRLFAPPPPSSGLILAHIFNVLQGYNFSAASINSTEDKILTYHRILEAFKFAYATRTKLGDPLFLNLTELQNNVVDPKFGRAIRLKINDSQTSNDTAAYGADLYSSPDAGTAHISIIAPNGDAVTVTSSVNYYFGAGFTTLRTGVIMNNVMDDFSSPGVTNYFGLKPSAANFIEPGKRPLSSMSPGIVIDSGGNAMLVIGASGGTKITTAVAMVAMRKLWFGQNIKQAVDEARIHHQLTPMNIEYEYGITEGILQGLKAKGHGAVRYRGRGSIVCALFRNDSGIFSNADYRKGGDVSGMD